MMKGVSINSIMSSFGIMYQNPHEIAVEKAEVTKNLNLTVQEDKEDSRKVFLLNRYVDDGTTDVTKKEVQHMLSSKSP